MNIFASHSTPVLCAQVLDNRRVVKMILETAQMLSTVLRKLSVDDPTLYKSAFQNHPCTLWAGATRGNFNWLVDHGLALSDEYSLRFDGKVHKSRAIIARCGSYNDLLPGDAMMTIFTNCTIFKEEEDVLIAYRKALSEKWFRDTNPQWGPRHPPEWLKCAWG